MKNDNVKFKIYLILFMIIANAFTWYSVFCEDRGGTLTVSFLSVGQGDAIFIDTPNGNQILLDGGPDKSVLRLLGKTMPFYDRSIDLLALSHPHSDHLIGLLDVLYRYSVFGFISSGTKVKNPEYISLTNYLESLSSDGVKNIITNRGMKIDMGDGVIIEVLMPSINVSTSTPHDGMLVLKLNYGKTSFLFTGDMEKNMEKYLISVEGEKLKSDVIKIGHHGSKNSTSESFIGYVSPKYAVISVGADNSYGHPASEVLDRLNKFGAQILRTDELRTITIKSDGEKIYEM